MEFLKRNFHLPDCWDLDQLEDNDSNLSVFHQIDRSIGCQITLWVEM